MDIRLLLATEPSQDRAARSTAAIRSASTDTTHSTNTSVTNAPGAPALRRDAARVLQGLFDGQPTSPASRPSSPDLTVPVRSATGPLDALDQPPLAEKRTRPQRTLSKVSQHNDHCPIPPILPMIDTTVTARVGPLGSSFSYTPLPEDYYFRDPEYDYAAAQDYLDSVDSESDSSVEEPETPPPDYMGTGTPIITPRLLEKVLQARAAGQPLQVSHMDGIRKKPKKPRKKKEGADTKEKKRKGKEKESSKENRKRSQTFERGGSAALSVSSSTQGARRSIGLDRPSVGSKRGREDDDDDEHDRKRRGPYSDASSTPTATEAAVRKPKGWKGWALVEVSSSEDERRNLYDEEGHRIRESESSSEDEAEIERLKQKPGWKGWALVKDPPDRSKLIKLDAPPMVLTTRATRSGRTFGDDNLDENGLERLGGPQSGRRGSSSSATQKSGRFSTVGVNGRS